MKNEEFNTNKYQLSTKLKLTIIENSIQTGLEIL